MTNYYTLDEKIIALRLELSALEKEQKKIAQLERENLIRDRLKKVDNYELAVLLYKMVSSIRQIHLPDRYLPNENEFNKAALLVGDIFK